MAVTLEIFRKMVASLPETSEAPHHDKTSFKVKNKIFATYNPAFDRACLKFSEVDQNIFSLAANNIIYPVPNKWGKNGWTLVMLEKLDSEQFNDALIAAYCEVAPKKLGDKVKSGVL